MEGTREAEMIVQFALQGMMYALRLSGSAAKNIAAMLAAVAKQPDKSPGATRMKALLDTGEPLDYYTVPDVKMKEFATLAKDYGIQYCVALNQDGAYDLVVKKSDSPRINRIAELLGIGAVQGSMDMNLTEEERAQAQDITPEQKMMQDMMSPNREEREQTEPNFNLELQEGVPVSGSSSQSFNQRESVMQQVNGYKTATDSARDMFADARSLREAAMSDLPDGMEPVTVSIGWDRPLERYNEDGERLYRGKTVDQMTDIDRMQYMVDQEMLTNGKLSENFINSMYESGYKVDESGTVSKDDTKLTSEERKMIADMMRDPERSAEKTLQAGSAAVDKMKDIKEAVRNEN